MLGFRDDLVEHALRERITRGRPRRHVQAILSGRQLDGDPFGEHQFTDDGRGQTEPREAGMQPWTACHVVMHDKVQIVGQRRARKITFSHEA
ncbi:hypothetical protein GCM10009677_34950 [Sphaerisporangium rubeum]